MLGRAMQPYSINQALQYQSSLTVLIKPYSINQAFQYSIKPYSIPSSLTVCHPALQYDIIPYSINQALQHTILERLRLFER
jgi:hypothetical protein